MKIAYVLVPSAVISGSSNGIRSQAKTWKSVLEQRGHKIEEIDVWKNYDWTGFDLIHIFGTGLWLFPFVNAIRSKNKNIVVSPIIDSVVNPNLYRLSTFLGNKRLRLWSPTYTLKQTLPLIKGIFVRSNYEASYINGKKAKSLVTKMPLCISINPKDLPSISKKESFCLHISSLHHERKNVIRLVKAAKKYDFKLVLAGNKGRPSQFEAIKNEIGDSKNIEVLGFISEEKKMELYAKAKIFALPSLNEGVGIVALDAAAMGCEIAITRIGGPKEYYNDMAELVDPLSVNSIGEAITNLLSDKVSYQPALREYILENFSTYAVANSLEYKYEQLIV